jgi:hypothetical protein
MRAARYDGADSVRAPALGDFVHLDFGNAVAHVLGLSDPHLG